MSTEVAIHTSLEELSRLSKSMADPQSVAPEELQQACLRFMGVANYYETLFYAWDRGEVDDEFWQSRRTRMANFIGPAEHSLWPMMKNSFGQRFQNFIDDDLFPDLAPDRPSWMKEA